MRFERRYENHVFGKIDDARFAKVSKRYKQKPAENAGRFKALRLAPKKPDAPRAGRPAGNKKMLSRKPCPRTSCHMDLEIKMRRIIKRTFRILADTPHGFRHNGATLR